MAPYKHIYGPIKSRRLGKSLGVDMVPHKTCSLDCVYCECGATTVLTAERREYIPTGPIIAEIDDYLSNNPPPDYVTFGGSGEPTLHNGLGAIIKHLKGRFPSQKLALLTNSTLLGDEQLRRDILPCDLILPSLDAVSNDVFRKVNLPENSICCEKIINGLIALSSEYKGEIWLEVFIAPGINDTDDEILLFKDVIARINPTIIQLNSLDRPGTCSTLGVASRASLEDIARRFAPLPVEIISSRHPPSSPQSSPSSTRKTYRP
jgi:wyosine [tRNA(Phe)-imidazoG37] synthetase (radical SAM superfamily)